jgi:hypothetical protein
MAVGHPLLTSFIAHYSGLALTLMGALFLLAVHFSGEFVATSFERCIGQVSSRLGHSVGHKIRAFRAGQDALRSIKDFAAIGFLSVAM